MTEINFRYLFSWWKLIFKTIDLPVYLFSKLQLLWNISKRITVIRVRNQYLSGSFDRWSYQDDGQGSYFLNWFILLSPCFSTQLNKRYYYPNYQGIPAHWGNRFAVNLTVVGKAQPPKIYFPPACKLPGTLQWRMIPLSYCPFLSTIVYNLNFTLCHPFTSYITNFPTNTMLVLM